MSIVHKVSPPIAFDLAAHHALGGGSYAFKEDYPSYLKSLLPDVPRVEVNIIIQPNSSPHIGTLSSLGLAFVVARRLRDAGTEVLVRCDLWDNAKGEQLEISGKKYQRSLRDTGRFQEHLPDYEHVLAALSRRFSIPHDIRLEEEFLRQPGMPAVLRRIVRDREAIAKVLAPTTGRIALRAPCPSCGLVEKHGLDNTYSEDHSSVTFRCPHHGDFTYNVEEHTSKFQFNCQLLNLVMGFFYEEQADYGWIEICGSDYAGFWQEQLLWRFLAKPPLIVYTPLISDWSGLKVSKSLYLRPSAYDYLRSAGLEYMLSYAVVRRENRSLDPLWEEIEKWVDEPYRLFRGYSIHYMHLVLSGTGVQHVTIHLSGDVPTDGDSEKCAGAADADGSPGAAFHMNSAASDWPSDGVNGGEFTAPSCA